MSSTSNSEFIATHVHPAWKGKADYIFRCRIESKNDRDEWEQMWGKVIVEHTYMVCCIPFFIYGLSLGDVVKVNEDGDFEILEKSSQNTIRIWIDNAEIATKSDIISKVLNFCDNAEMHSDILFAFSVCNERYAAMISLLNEEAMQSGIIYEIANN